MEVDAKSVSGNGDNEAQVFVVVATHEVLHTISDMIHRNTSSNNGTLTHAARSSLSANVLGRELYEWLQANGSYFHYANRRIASQSRAFSFWRADAITGWNCLCHTLPSMSSYCSIRCWNSMFLYDSKWECPRDGEMTIF
jgi:hypothetical protein